MEKHRHNTAQHAAIVKYLKKNKHHPNIIDIYKNVSKKLSTISMTTVYNTIDILKKEGLIQELFVSHHGGIRFDFNPEPHHHIICSICGNIVDVEFDVNHSLLLTEIQKHGFEINKTCINFYGVCSNCKNNETVIRQ